MGFPGGSSVKGFPGAQMVKNLPAVWETQVRSLGREDPLEEAVAPHSSVLAWRIPWTEEAVAPHSSVLAWRIPWTEEAMAPHSSVLAWRIPWTVAWWVTVDGAAESDRPE